MPLPRLPTDLRKAVSSFTAEQRLLLKQPEMQQQMRVLGDFSRSLRLAGDVAPAEPAVAQNALDWMQRLPEPLLASDKAPLVDLNRLSLPDAHLALLDGLQVLALGAKALLGTAERQPKLAPQALVQVAFGNDAASLALRKPLLDRKAPGLPPLPGPDVRQLPGLDRLPDISRLVREGTLRELVRSFADCGHMAQAEADWVARVQPIGQVTRMKADRPCGGGTLFLAYAGFGARPPPPDQVADILVALPTRSGCTHISLRKFDPGFFDPARWADQGKLALTLPDAVISGAVGFFSVPPPMADAGPCVSGGLATAAGMMRAAGQACRRGLRRAVRPDHRRPGRPRRGRAPPAAALRHGAGRQAQPAHRRAALHRQVPRGRDRAGAPARHGHGGMVHLQCADGGDRGGGCP